MIQRALDAGVEMIVAVGNGDVAKDSHAAAHRLAERYNFIYTTVGVHPHEARLLDADSVDTRGEGAGLVVPVGAGRPDGLLPRHLPESKAEGGRCPRPGRKRRRPDLAWFLVLPPATRLRRARAHRHDGGAVARRKIRAALRPSGRGGAQHRRPIGPIVAARTPHAGSMLSQAWYGLCYAGRSVALSAP